PLGRPTITGGLRRFREGSASGAEAVFAESEHFVAVFGDEDGVLGLGAELAVSSDGGPAVFEDLALGCASVDHRFDGEGHALHHAFARTPAPDMRDLGLGVELATDTVSAEGLDHAVAV